MVNALRTVAFQGGAVVKAYFYLDPQAILNHYLCHEQALHMPERERKRCAAAWDPLGVTPAGTTAQNGLKNPGVPPKYTLGQHITKKSHILNG